MAAIEANALVDLLQVNTVGIGPRLPAVAYRFGPFPMGLLRNSEGDGFGANTLDDPDVSQLVGCRLDRQAGHLTLMPF